MRRAVDVVVAGAVLVMVSPLLLLVAVAVRLTSRGPAIFRQERVGRGGAPFHILKFRTMRSGETGPGLAVADDARVTALGTVLRRHRLDELPQLVNVVRGEMSLVGPRPEVPRFARTRGEEQARVLESVRPGMTGPTTVAFAHEAQLLRGQADPERLLPRRAAAAQDPARRRVRRHPDAARRPARPVAHPGCAGPPAAAVGPGVGGGDAARIVSHRGSATVAGSRRPPARRGRHRPATGADRWARRARRASHG